MDTAQEQLSFRAVMQIAPFRRLWLGQTVSLFGDFLVLFGVLSVASFKLHATPAQITGISISFLVPFAFIGPLAGVFVDRWNVKRTMIASDLIRAGLALLLIFVPGLYGIYAILIALSTVSTFFMPAQSVTVRALVPPHGLLAANALMQQALQVIRIISPAIAGSLVAFLGAEVCYYVDSFSFLFSAAMIAPLLIRRESVTAATGKNTISSVMHQFGEGAQFIFTHSAISFVIISLTAGMFAISCFGPLIAVYVRDYLKANEVVFGVVNSLVGVGMIACTMMINKFARTRSKTRMVVEGLLIIGISVVLLAAFGHVLMTGTAMFGIGVGAALIMIPSQALIQGATPIAMVGRVSSSVWSLLSVAQVVGLVFSGSLAQRLGVVTLFYLSAAMLVLIAIFGFFRLSSRTPERGAPAPADAPD